MYTLYSSSYKLARFSLFIDSMDFMRMMAMDKRETVDDFLARTAFWRLHIYLSGTLMGLKCGQEGDFDKVVIPTMLYGDADKKFSMNK
jgi:hypothetical protein